MEHAQPAGEILYTPTAEELARTNMARYAEWLRTTRGLTLPDYPALWRWSVDEIETFWASLWEHLPVKAHRPYEQVLSTRAMPGAVWFSGAELNYAEHALRRQDDHPAILFKSENRPLSVLTYADLHRQVARVAAGLRRLGVGRGDRVVAYMPNIPESLIAFLATASLGAIWSSSSPEFGTRAVVDRFRQINPKVMFAVDGYQYNGKPNARLSTIAAIQENLPSLAGTVLVPYLESSPETGALQSTVTWAELTAAEEPLTFTPVPFGHPLWVVYSSGTTGLPKPLVHSHGGIILEHYKLLHLQMDLTEQDRFFWFSSTSWIMWNILIGGLLLGSTVVLYDGSPGYPDLKVLWQLAAEAEVTYFGTSAPYLVGLMKEGFSPRSHYDLKHLRTVGSTGAPLPPEGFRWIHQAVKPAIPIQSVSGGTDVATAFVGSCPTLPVYAGEIQCRGLGVAVAAFDENGRPVIDQVGEMVITAPMPSMPIFFWNDPEGQRYRESYFDTFPGVWRHGDWLRITGRESCIVYGRSDSTLKRAGVRMGTSEFYRVVEDLPEVADSLVVDTSGLGQEGRLYLFMALRAGASLDQSLRVRINDRIRRELSPRHVPDEIHAVPEIPRTLNGKKLEVPVRRILLGTPVSEAVNADALSNPESLAFYVALASSRRRD